MAVIVAQPPLGLQPLIVAAFVALALLGIAPCALGADAPADRAALATLYAATGGANWADRSNWLVASASMCTWSGVECAPSQCATAPLSNATLLCRVTSIQLPRNRLAGALPVVGFFNRMASLTHLDLAGNPQLASSIPATVCDSTSLLHIALQLCGFVGSIPPCISTMVQLQHVSLAENRLVGPAPDLSALTGLVTLELGGNAFSGEFPLSSLSGMRNLVTLSLSYEPNPLRPTYTNSTFYASRDLVSLCGLVKLQTLIAVAFGLTGAAPTCFANLTKLANVNLALNKLTSSLWDFSLQSNLQRLVVNGNFLSGSLPVSLCQTDLQTLSLNDNRFSGPIPSCIGDLSNLQTLHLGNNAFHSSLPESFGFLQSVSYLNLSNNRFSSTIPSSWFDMSALRDLDLSHNQLVGNIPSEWNQLAELVRLQLQHNSLSGDLALHRSPGARLVLIDVSHNRFGPTLTPLAPLTNADTSLRWLVAFFCTFFHGYFVQILKYFTHASTFNPALSPQVGCSLECVLLPIPGVCGFGRGRAQIAMSDRRGNPGAAHCGGRRSGGHSNCSSFSAASKLQGVQTVRETRRICIHAGRRGRGSGV